MIEIQSKKKLIQNIRSNKYLKLHAYAYINNWRTASGVTMIEFNVICKFIDLLTRHYYN
jgi:hypothetical protein